MYPSPDSCSVIQVKQGDTARIITATLFMGCLPFSLVNASSVSLNIQQQNVPDIEVASRVATIVSPAINGQVSYQLQADDVDTPGVFNCSWVVTQEDLTQLTFPTEGFITLIVNPAL